MLTSKLLSTRMLDQVLFSKNCIFQKFCRFQLMLGLIVAVVLSLTPRLASAELINISTAVVAPGQSGYLDVYFGETSGEYSLAGYQIELNLTGPDSNVWFTEFAEPANPIFPGQVPAQTPPRYGLPGMVAAANDFLPSGEALIEEGAGLLRVVFATTPDSMGTYYVTVDTDIMRTNFSDGSGTLIPIADFGTGTIVVVPEPSSLLLLYGIVAFSVIAYKLLPKND